MYIAVNDRITTHFFVLVKCYRFRRVYTLNSIATAVPTIIYAQRIENRKYYLFYIYCILLLHHCVHIGNFGLLFNVTHQLGSLCITLGLETRFKVCVLFILQYCTVQCCKPNDWNMF